MNNIQQNSLSLKSLRIVYFGMMTGMVLFAVISYFIRTSDTDIAFLIEVEKELLIGALFISTACLTASGILWKKRMEQARSMNTLAEKFDAYRAAALVRYALTEGPGLFAIVCFLLTGNIRFLAVVGLLIVAFILMYPSANKIGSELQEDPGSIEAL